MRIQRFSSSPRGFTLVEVLVGAAVFLVISTAVYQAYGSLFQLISLNQYKILALNLANEQLEIIRNLSYEDVKGVTVQDFVRGGVLFMATTTVQSISEPLEGKLVEVEVDCTECVHFTPIALTTLIAP